jgi:hypothetical protein
MYIIFFPFLQLLLGSLKVQKKQRFYLIWSLQVMLSMYKLHNNDSPISMLQAYYLTDMIYIYALQPYPKARMLEYIMHHVLSLYVLTKTNYIPIILMHLKYIEYSNVALILYYYSNKIIKNDTYKLCSAMSETIVYVFCRCIAVTKKTNLTLIAYHDLPLFYLIITMNVFFSCQVVLSCIFTILSYVKTKSINRNHPNVKL